MILLIKSFLVISDIDFVIAQKYFGNAVELLESRQQLNFSLLKPSDIVVYYTGDVDRGVFPSDFESRVRQHSAVVLGLEPSLELPAQILRCGSLSGYYRTSSIQPFSLICRLVLKAQPELMRHYDVHKLPYWLPDLCAP